MLVDYVKYMLDLQYYIFVNDVIGCLVVQCLLVVVDCGVCVCLLLDDINIDKQFDMFDVLDLYFNIEVWLFNLFGICVCFGLVKVMQFVFDGSCLNYCMYNKLFIVDNMVVIVGGCNIGDDYFDVGESMYFCDLDLIVIGLVVCQVLQVFDEYWNCDVVYLVKVFSGKYLGYFELVILCQQLVYDVCQFVQSDYVQVMLEQLLYGFFGDCLGKWFWGYVILVVDQLVKIDVDGDDLSLCIGFNIKVMFDGVQCDVQMILLYFIFGDDGIVFFIGLVKCGVCVQVFINLLVFIDEFVVYVGYLCYWLLLLCGGVQLYELCFVLGVKQLVIDVGKFFGVSLYVKVIVVDVYEVFIGLMNMDECFKLFNIEMGIIVDNVLLVEVVECYFDDVICFISVWCVMFDLIKLVVDVGLCWQGDEGGQLVIYDSDLDVIVGCKVEVGLIKLLLVESLL